MKKIFITMLMLVSIVVTSNANAVNIANVLVPNSREFVVNSNINNVDSVKFYDMHLNNRIKNLRRFLYLDDVQEKLLYDVQNGVESAFEHLNEMNDSIAKINYISNTMKYWNTAARTSFYSTDRLDAHKMFKKYWTCVNVTMRNKGYIDEKGNYVIH